MLILLYACFSAVGSARNKVFIPEVSPFQSQQDFEKIESSDSLFGDDTKNKFYYGKGNSPVTCSSSEDQKSNNIKNDGDYTHFAPMKTLHLEELQSSMEEEQNFSQCESVDGDIFSHLELLQNKIEEFWEG